MLPKDWVCLNIRIKIIVCTAWTIGTYFVSLFLWTVIYSLWFFFKELYVHVVLKVLSKIFIFSFLIKWLAKLKVPVTHFHFDIFPCWPLGHTILFWCKWSTFICNILLHCYVIALFSLFLIVNFNYCCFPMNSVTRIIPSMHLFIDVFIFTSHGPKKIFPAVTTRG